MTLDGMNANIRLFIKGFVPSKYIRRRNIRELALLSLITIVIILGNYVSPDYGFYVSCGLIVGALYLFGAFKKETLQKLQMETRNALNLSTLPERIGAHVYMAFSEGLIFGTVLFLVFYFLGYIPIDYIPTFAWLFLMGGFIFGGWMSCGESSSTIVRVTANIIFGGAALVTILVSAI